ncbi:3-isopropylmalate dehydratase small subunit, partial [Leptospira interrogans serovar Pomona]|nr:3-isopropylmalate dehydratase small subunit [Leptospira interrogans serovar Pomona]
QTVTGPTGKVYTFEVDSFRKYCLYNGLDDIGLTLKQGSKIGAFEKKQKEVEPWLYVI